MKLHSIFLPCLAFSGFFLAQHQENMRSQMIEEPLQDRESFSPCSQTARSDTDAYVADNQQLGEEVRSEGESSYFSSRVASPRNGLECDNPLNLSEPSDDNSDDKRLQRTDGKTLFKSSSKKYEEEKNAE